MFSLDIVEPEIQWGAGIFIAALGFAQVLAGAMCIVAGAANLGVPMMMRGVQDLYQAMNIMSGGPFSWKQFFIDKAINRAVDTIVIGIEGMLAPAAGTAAADVGADSAKAALKEALIQVAVNTGMDCAATKISKEVLKGFKDDIHDTVSNKVTECLHQSTVQNSLNHIVAIDDFNKNFRGQTAINTAVNDILTNKRNVIVDIATQGMDALSYSANSTVKAIGIIARVGKAGHDISKLQAFTDAFCHSLASRITRTEQELPTISDLLYSSMNPIVNMSDAQAIVQILEQAGMVKHNRLGSSTIEGIEQVKFGKYELHRVRIIEFVRKLAHSLSKDYSGSIDQLSRDIVTIVSNQLMGKLHNQLVCPMVKEGVRPVSQLISDKLIEGSNHLEKILKEHRTSNGSRTFVSEPKVQNFAAIAAGDEMEIGDYQYSRGHSEPHGGHKHERSEGSSKEVTKVKPKLPLNPPPPRQEPKPLSQSELSAAQFLVDTLTADKRQLQAKENEYHRNILQIAKHNMHDSAAKKFAQDEALMQQAYAIGGEIGLDYDPRAKKFIEENPRTALALAAAPYVGMGVGLLGEIGFGAAVRLLPTIAAEGGGGSSIFSGSRFANAFFMNESAGAAAATVTRFSASTTAVLPNPNFVIGASAIPLAAAVALKATNDDNIKELWNQFANPTTLTPTQPVKIWDVNKPLPTNINPCAIIDLDANKPIILTTPIPSEKPITVISTLYSFNATDSGEIVLPPELLGKAISPINAFNISNDFEKRKHDDISNKPSTSKQQQKVSASFMPDPGDLEPDDEQHRKYNCEKSESPIWKELKPYKGKTKTNGLSGNKQRFYQWDHTHNDIEVYDSNGCHQGSINPKTGELYKEPVKGRQLGI
ncbi:colicin E3/pyocin S6 family cytotoxin [Candidatus Tisiphia endosymbiont of Piscicola geometra]|uniref:colicin E3/pyocin S6 family cytotoxin n=1 Tax=Candidatus Tisiphia endosymbiont of Piscicola geometra TaxID=3066273 RepID=UPI00312C8749